MTTKLILQNITEVVELNPDEKVFFTSLLRHKSIRRKRVLHQKGQIASDIYFVNTGCLRVFNVDDDGKTHVASFAIEKYWVSDFCSGFACLR